SPPASPALPPTTTAAAGGLAVQASAPPRVPATQMVGLTAFALTAPSAVTFQWVQRGGTPVTLQHASSATPTFAAPDLLDDEVLTFEVTATAADGTVRQTL